MKIISSYELELMLSRIPSEASVRVAALDALTTSANRDEIAKELTRHLADNRQHQVVFLIKL